MVDKTLGQVAWKAYSGTLCRNFEESWQAVADAVVAEYEARRLRPIDTAPKDGTEIDLWSVNGRWPECKWDNTRLEWVHWSLGGFDVMCWCVLGEQVTHWTPIPAPPKEADHGK